jgi:hypothetical protein
MEPTRRLWVSRLLVVVVVPVRLPHHLPEMAQTAAQVAVVPSTTAVYPARLYNREPIQPLPLTQATMVELGLTKAPVVEVQAAIPAADLAVPVCHRQLLERQFSTAAVVTEQSSLQELRRQDQREQIQTEPMELEPQVAQAPTTRALQVATA